MKKVILQQQIPDLGDAGEIVSVRDGYARNYLLPRKLALLAEEGNIRQFNHQKKLTQDRMKKIIKGYKDLAQKIEGVSCTITRKAGEEGRLFGSITAQDIADALATQGLTVDRRKIELTQPIKTTGAHTVPVRLHADVHAEVRVSVEAE